MVSLKYSLAVGGFKWFYKISEFVVCVKNHNNAAEMKMNALMDDGMVLIAIIAQVTFHMCDESLNLYCIG